MNAKIGGVETVAITLDKGNGSHCRNEVAVLMRCQQHRRHSTGDEDDGEKEESVGNEVHRTEVPRMTRRC